MRKLRHYVALFALVVFSTTTFYAPPAQALGNSVLIDYYDSCLNIVGWHYRNCSSSVSSEGTLAGEWKEVITEGCSYPWNYDIQAYHSCSGQWIPVSQVGDPSC